MTFFSILMIFRSLCLFGAILAQKLNSFICKKNSDFLTPLGPLGARPYRFEQKNIASHHFLPLKWDAVQLKE